MTRPHDDPPDQSDGDVRRRVRQRARRPRDGVRRPHSLTLALSDQELAVLDAASTRAELSLGAWVASVAVARATGEQHPTPVTGGELARRIGVAADEARTGWRLLRVVGGLLNQVAKIGNSTGALPPQTGEVLARVVRAAEGADAAAATLHRLANELATRLPQPARARKTHQR